MKAIFWGLCFYLISFVVSVQAQSAVEEGESGLAVPRMVALRSNMVNARSGPGSRYPISWIYRQKHAPVEVIAEFQLWRKIRDWKGAEAWVHTSTLTGIRTAKFVTPGENNIYDKPDYNSKVVAKAEEEVIGNVIKCPAGKSFCLLSFEDSIEGWASKKELFGIYPDEIID